MGSAHVAAARVRYGTTLDDEGVERGADTHVVSGRGDGGMGRPALSLAPGLRLVSSPITTRAPLYRYVGCDILAEPAWTAVPAGLPGS